MRRLARGCVAGFAATLVACGAGACSAGGGNGAVFPLPDGSADGGADREGPLGDAGRESSGSAALAVTVSGKNLVDGSGQPLRLIGVNHSGAEYRCVQPAGAIFDSPADDALVAGMARWHVNAVRFGLNEDCWLGINGVDPRYSGAPYRTAILELVKRLHAHGLYAVVEVHWNAPGANKAMDQQPMLDADHGAALWSSIATALKDDPATLFDLYNEPYIDTANAMTTDPWDCWKNGCTITTGAGFSGSYASAGMQTLVDAVRATGAKQVILLGGLAYANDLSGWLSHKPFDPANALAASFHVYNFNTCVTASCWDGQVAPVAAVVPLVTGEIGEDDCAHAFIDRYMSWADARGVSYVAWTWNPWDCAKGPALIRDWSGTPTAFGVGFRDHAQALLP